MEKFIQETTFKPVEFDPFQGPTIVRTAPSTEAQREVWVVSQMGKEASSAYIESVSLELKSDSAESAVDAELMEATIRRLVERHEGLRSVLSADGMRVIVLEDVNVPFTFTDLANSSADEQKKQLKAIADSDMSAAFDLLNGPLFRVQLIRTSDTSHLLRLSGHHVIVDGWSLGIIMADVSSIYSALKAGREPALSEAFRFSDYAIAQIDFAKSPEHTQVERYWLDLFAGSIPRVDLPTDRPRPKVKHYSGNRLDLAMDAALVQRLRETATRNGASFVTTLLTSFELLIHKLTGDRDLVVGLPAAGQSDYDMKELVGHCVNLLALRSHVDEEMPFSEHLKNRRTGVLDAFDNQKYTFGTLVRKLNVPREPGRIPLCPVVFNVDMNMDDGVAFTDIKHRFISNPRSAEHFELFLNATGNDDGMILEWSYDTALFDEATIRGWMDEFRSLIARINVNANLPIGTLLGDEDLATEAILPPAEWNGIHSDIPRDKGMDGLFDEVVGSHGSSTALVMASGELSYDQLHARVLCFSGALQAAGVKPGDPVGLCTDRSPDMVAAMLAILRCGAAFVPFDPSYPMERLEFMFRDTDVSVLVTEGHLLDGLPKHSAKTLLLEEIANASPSTQPPLGKPDSAAYIMYTSGSTGEPKGVVVPHRAVTRLVRDQNYLPFGPDLTFLQLSNISFDASTLELWGALLNGAKLVLQPQQKPTLQEIISTIREQKVTTVWFTAGLFNLLVDEHVEGLRGLKHILTGGDVLSAPHVKRALRVVGPGVLINGYGPTENTTFTCCYAIDDEQALKARVPIGKPIANTTIYILDEAMHPVAIGGKGELYTGGAGVALGYWRKPELTAEQFVDDPFSKTAGAKLYRTGDFVRWLPDGTIDFLGRGDGQVKVRGFRVELGEIENAISELSEVKDSVVIVRSDLPGEKQLVAYVVPRELSQMAEDVAEQEVLIHSVREHLRNVLPGHMVPTAFVILPELPLTANGKVDKRALPLPLHRVQTMEVKHVGPRNAKEQLLAELWSELLNVPGIGIHDNFFDMGGHSLIGIQLLARIGERFGKSLPLNSLFQAPTIASFAKLLQSENEVTGLKNLAALQSAGDRIPFFCVHGDEANHHIMRYLGKDQPYYAFFHQGEDGAQFQYKTVEEIATHYVNELTAVQPEGPYLIGGYSFGGVVAYEMAGQLRAAGHEVPLLAMFDMYAPKHFIRTMSASNKFYEPLKRIVMRWLTDRELAKGNIRSHNLRHFNIIDNYHQAILNYDPKPYDGPVTVFKADRSPGPDDMGWSSLVSGPLDIRVVPGDHYSLIKDPEVMHLVKELSASIDRAVSKHSVVAV